MFEGAPCEHLLPDSRRGKAIAVVNMRGVSVEVEPGDDGLYRPCGRSGYLYRMGAAGPQKGLCWQHERMRSSRLRFATPEAERRTPPRREVYLQAAGAVRRSVGDILKRQAESKERGRTKDNRCPNCGDFLAMRGDAPGGYCLGCGFNDTRQSDALDWLMKVSTMARGMSADHLMELCNLLTKAYREGVEHGIETQRHRTATLPTTRKVT